MNEFEYQVDNFMLYCESKHLSRKTLSSYEQTLRLFQNYLENEHKIDDVNDVKARHIRAYIKYLRERGKYTVVANDTSKKTNYPDRRVDKGEPLSDSTIANYLRNIRVFFNFLKSEHEIRDNPTKNIKNIKPTRKQKQTLHKNQLQKLFKAMDITKFHEYRLWIQSRLCLDTGIRATESCNLMPDDIDFRFNSLLIRKPKNNRERYVYFSQIMNRDLRRWLNYKDRYIDSDYLFPTIRGTKQDVRNFARSLRTVSDRVNIDVHPHLFRNTFAKTYILNGGDWASLSRILGHSSADVTQKHYLDFTNEEVRQQYQKHSPLDTLKL